MDAPLDVLHTAEHDAFPCDRWCDAAESLYGFDRRTAQRLAFARWLRATGRLNDDADADQEARLHEPEPPPPGPVPPEPPPERPEPKPPLPRGPRFFWRLSGR